MTENKTEAKSPETFVHAKSHRTPATALRLIERTDDHVVVAPYHGGFAMRVPQAVFNKEYVQVDLDDLYCFRKGRFSVEGGDAFDGFTDGRVWNGWACPLATEAVAEKLLQTCCDGETLTYSREGKVLCVTDSNYPDESYQLAASEIEIDGQKYEVYDLGELGWCFTEEITC